MNAGTQAKRVGWVLRGTQYNTSTLLIFVVLAERSNDRGCCWPSVRSIAEDSRCSERTVQLAVKRLVKDGWIKVDRQQSSTGTNVYHLNLLRLEQSHDAAVERRRKRYEAENTAARFPDAQPPAPPVDKPQQTVEPTPISVDKADRSGGNPSEKPSAQEPIRVQITTPRGATSGSQGCKAFAPKPQEPPGTPTGKSKRTFDGDGRFPVFSTPTPNRSLQALRFMQAPP